MYDLVLLGGILVTPQGRYRADVGVQRGRIVTIAEDLTSACSQRVISAVDKYILPGCIDGHMHLWEPGLVADPDFRAGTLAAAAGGVTTIVDHPLTIPEVLTAEVFEEKRELGERTSYVDFALHGGVNPDNMAELPKLWHAGCTAFKIFMCDSGSKVSGLSDGELLDALQIIGSFGGTVLLHAENDAMLRHNRNRLEQEQRTDYMAFVEWRPPEVEAEAINRALFLLTSTRTRAIFLHTTIPEGVSMVNEARRRGMDVWVETCPHILYLTHEDLRERGPWVTFAPPLRDRARVEQLWSQLSEGKIHLLGSDHGPVARERKEAGLKNIWKSQFGVPGAETLVCMMLNAVAEGRITLEHLSNLLAETPARLYGLYPRKGAILVGSDADFTVVDMGQSYPVRASEMRTSCGWTPYEGRVITGKVTHTVLRGKVIMEMGEIFGQPGDGQFVPRRS